MTNLFDCYRILEVSAGAGIADVTTSYRRLCRLHHPDLNDDPESMEMMKSINMAYSVLREKLGREAALRENRQARQARRYTSQAARTADTRKASAEKEAAEALHGYFSAIKAFDYPRAYSFLCGFDKLRITQESFIKWRKSVARLFPIHDFTIGCGSAEAVIPMQGCTPVRARRFRVEVTEEDVANNAVRSGEFEKYVLFENGSWKVFLGYKSLADLTSTFDKQFETGRKRDISKRWEEYFSGLEPELNMLSLTGFRKAVSRELYRQNRFGGTVTFAAISVNSGGASGDVQGHLHRSASAAIREALRETDITAYLGGGVFALLLIELGKENAEEIITRLAEKIRTKAGPYPGRRAEIKFSHESWTGQGSASIDDINEVLKEFGKKM